MDLKNLLGKLDVIEGTMKSAERNPTGPKFTGQWKGTDKGLPGKKLVGDSVEPENILKDLSKGKTPKTKEQELAEEFQAFLEAEFKDTVDKRPARKNARPARGHKEEPRYKTIKAEGATDQVYTVEITRSRGMGSSTTRTTSGTLAELIDYFGYTLEVGKSYEHERGRYKINMNPRNINQLVDSLNKAASNGAANGAASTYYSVGQSQVAEGYDSRDAYELEDPKHPDFVKNYEEYKAKHPDAKLADFIAFLRSKKTKTNEGVPYKATNPHPASKDPIVAKVLKQMRPGLTGLEMNNEAFLYFAYEIGKMRAREMWEDYGPAIKHFYQSGIGVNEGWESGPEEYEEPYDDADDAYDRRRQEKLDIEAEKANAKRPQEKVYTLLGRGPNMEPNYKFPGEYKSQEDAIAAREKIMADPSTPHPEHIGIHSYTRYLDQANESIDSDIVQPMGQDAFNRAGYNPIRDERDYLDKLRDLSNLSRKPGLDQAMKAQIEQRIRDLNAEARKKGFIQAESRGHKIIATKLKDIERAKTFRVPSPEERKELEQRMKDFEAQLAAAKSKKKSKVDEYGANNVSPYGQQTQKVDPKQAQQVAANLNIQKTALNQLKQINPEIDPVKAATAMTKDPETMNPQEKEAAAQVAKTVSPALGSPAFGSLKTAIQKLQAKK